ncbi:hypothetical protein BLA13014_01503 [Burkholderia aenigmatica]|uniref:Uncharacterized protein n=1 Tax=Burkholderia aenigmatica TaxID=2015348 RepID=A0A6P2J1F0_9BURK|nr:MULTISPECIES: hypothetical protein [Burkholderia]VWB36917.1 hypothetical protein BLA13014_01503 [Burkholderia aenigmatica]
MAIHVIEDYRNFGSKAKELYREIEGEMEGALFLLAESIIKTDIEPENWSRKLFKNPSDAVLFIEDLRDESDCYRIVDKIYNPFFYQWCICHFNSLEELAELLVTYDEEFSQFIDEHG